MNQSQSGSEAKSQTWVEAKSQTWTENQENWEEKNISPEIEKELKAYEEQLKQEQKQNQDQVWKVYQPQSLNDPFSQFDSFFNNPFFDNSLLQWGDNQKDW
jgi:hypothetical protein